MEFRATGRGPHACGNLARAVLGQPPRRHGALEWSERTHIMRGILLPILLTCATTIASSEPTVRVDLRTERTREQTVERLREARRQERRQALRIAREKGWRIRTRSDGRVCELIAVRNGRPVYLAPCNETAAVATGAGHILDIPPYNLTGAQVLVGLWDQGVPLPGHQEFGGRVSIRDGEADTSDHSTHVAGTIGASGVEPRAKGMAPGVRIDSYDWLEDDAEMTLRALTAPGQADKIPLSNHSYGILAGWVADTDFSGQRGPHWFGDLDEGEDAVFGQYDATARVWDVLCHNAQYFLPIKAAGGQRDDRAPESGTPYFFFGGDDWASDTYDPSSGPPDDGWKNGGYDTLTDASCAKNVLTVGAVGNVVQNGARRPAGASQTSFSGWGPTDDGRIKPDVVTHGVAVYSTSDAGPDQYTSRTGTSMATAATCGAAALLVDYFSRLLPGSAMRASTLKALLIHTADDLGPAGPDYMNGWGLVNAHEAARQIRRYVSFAGYHCIHEGALTAANPVQTVVFQWSGETAIRATLCWTDPAGLEQVALNDPDPVLVNDLDLRVSSSAPASIHYPYVLNPSQPADAATTGDNVRDNVEQIVVSSPSPETTYRLTIFYKGTLQGDSQNYSVILSGHVPEAVAQAADWPLY